MDNIALDIPWSRGTNIPLLQDQASIKAVRPSEFSSQNSQSSKTEVTCMKLNDQGRGRDCFRKTWDTIEKQKPPTSVGGGHDRALFIPFYIELGDQDVPWTLRYLEPGTKFSNLHLSEVWDEGVMSRLREQVSLLAPVSVGEGSGLSGSLSRYLHQWIVQKMRLSSL